MQIVHASNVAGKPMGGIIPFVRRAEPETTPVETENSNIMVPEGGIFLILLSNPDTPEIKTAGRIAFGLWKDKISPECISQLIFTPFI